MKKVIVLCTALVLCFALFACGSDKDSAAKDEPKEPLDLTGEWTQSNPNSEDTWHEATIKDGAIEIYWVSDDGDTKSLYWAGTYKAPTDAVDEYNWTSENDKEKTDSALLASGDDTKDFAYKDGVISYEASAMGTTTTIKLEKK